MNVSSDVLLIIVGSIISPILGLLIHTYLVTKVWQPPSDDGIEYPEFLRKIIQRNVPWEPKRKYSFIFYALCGILFAITGSLCLIIIKPLNVELIEDNIYYIMLFLLMPVCVLLASVITKMISHAQGEDLEETPKEEKLNRWL